MDKLSNEEKSKALASLIFLKEKRDGKVKARSCANGSVQREHVAKEEAVRKWQCPEGTCGKEGSSGANCSS